MRNLPTLLSAVALTSAVALAQTVTVPNIFANTQGGTTGNVWRAGTNRVQSFYDSSNWAPQGVTGPISITSVEFRLAGNAVTNIVTYPSVSIYLQNAAVDYLTPQIQFDLNRTVAFPTTPNFSGSVTTLPVAGGSPNGYFINIPLTTPFIYDPSTGTDLLLEIEISAPPSPLTGNNIDAGYNAAAHACNSIRSVGSVTALTGSMSAFAPVARFGVSAVPGAAFNTSVGTGCNSRFASFYENFPSVANFDFPNSAITWIPNGGGYVMTNSGAFLPIGAIQATPTVLALDDETNITYPFTTGSFPGWTGLDISSNGMVANAPITGNDLYFDNDPSFNLNRLQTIFFCHADFHPFLATQTSPGVGTVQVEESTGVTTVTWNGVANWSNNTSLNTFQFQFYASGIVTLAIQTMGTADSQNPGLFIGYSPGGPSAIPPIKDLSAAATYPFVTEATDVFPLALAAGSRPITGTNWSLNASNVTASSVIGLEVFGLTDPGILDLAFIGMPGCGLRTSLDATNAFLVAGATHAYSLAIPANPTLVGLDVFSSTILLDPLANTFGALTSNAIKGTMGSL